MKAFLPIHHRAFNDFLPLHHPPGNFWFASGDSRNFCADKLIWSNRLHRALTKTIETCVWCKWMTIFAMLPKCVNNFGRLCSQTSRRELWSQNIYLRNKLNCRIVAPVVDEDVQLAHWNWAVNCELLFCCLNTSNLFLMTTEVIFFDTFQRLPTTWILFQKLKLKCVWDFIDSIFT